MDYLIRRMNRELRKARFRAIGSGALILIAVSTYITFASMVPSARESLELMVEDQNISDYIVHIAAGDSSTLDQVAAVSGIEVVDYRVVVNSNLEYEAGDGPLESTPATVVGVDPARPPLVNTLDVREGDGEYFSGDGGNGTVVVEGGFGHREGIRPGDHVAIEAIRGNLEFEVVGLAFSPEHIMLPMNPQSVIPLPGSLGVVYLPIDTLRQAFGFQENYINELLFIFDGSRPGDEVIDEINGVLSTNTIIFTQERDQLYGYSLLQADLSEGESMSGIIALLILLAAFFVTYSFFSRIVDEQRKEIGIMRALGYSRRSVLWSYLYMAFLIGLGGSIVGAIIGVPMGIWFGKFYVEQVFHGDLFELVLEIRYVLIGLFFGPVTACLASGVAVWGTVSMEPHEAIKDMRAGRPKPHRKSKGADSEKASSMSYITLYTLRNLFRHRRRMTFTVIAVAFSIVLGGMSFLMVESFENSITSSITDYENWDLIVDYAYPLDEVAAGNISVPGVVSEVQIAKLMVVWYADGASNEAVLIGLEAGQTLHDFAILKGTVAASQQEVMVGYELFDRYGLNPGDAITLEGSNGTAILTVSGVVADLAGQIFVDEEVVKTLFGTVIYSGMYVKCASDQIEQVREGLSALPFVANVQQKDDLQSGMIEFMRSYQGALYAFSLVGVAIATLTIANVVFMGVLERQREYGQLRAVGYTRSDTSKSIVTEILLIIAISAVAAIPLVLLVLVSLEDSFRAFWPTYSTMLGLDDWFGYGVVVLLTLLFGLLAALPAMRFVNRLDLARTVAGGRFG